jgi:hypothetical protein
MRKLFDGENYLRKYRWIEYWKVQETLRHIQVGEWRCLECPCWGTNPDVGIEHGVNHNHGVMINE